MNLLILLPFALLFADTLAHTKQICGQLGKKMPDSIPKLVNGSRIANGHETDHYLQYPWMAKILTDWTTQDGNLGHINCGASHIGDGYLLCAAHCFSDPEWKLKKVHVFLGENVISGIKEEFQIMREAKYVIHQDYVQKLDEKGYLAVIQNDIALLKICLNKTEQKRFTPICLPEMDNQIVDEKRCISAGWGITNATVGIISNVLLVVPTPIVPRNECLAEPSYLNLLENDKICAGDNRDAFPNVHSICAGDSGGPLMCPAKIKIDDNIVDAWMQKGIVSFGDNCGKVFGVYTMPEKHLDWIDKAKRYLDEQELSTKLHSV